MSDIIRKRLKHCQSKPANKGESSFWINQNKIVSEQFSWQDDYFAVSVSESKVGAVDNYIHNQEVHHAKKCFEDEVNEFMNKYGWQKIAG